MGSRIFYIIGEKIRYCFLHNVEKIGIYTVRVNIVSLIFCFKCPPPYTHTQDHHEHTFHSGGWVVIHKVRKASC